MSAFVLVHGSWHGAWCWEKVVRLLEDAGHSAVAVDLPGHGDDVTPLPEITLDAYARRISDTVAMQRPPVVLVGHSMGGGAITQAAEYCAPAVGVLVYLAAFVPGDGTSIVEQALGDEASLLPDAVALDSERGVATLDVSSIEACFYADCSTQDVAFATSRLRDDPLEPLVTPLSLGSAPARALPRIYIECLRDAALSVDHQRRVRGHLEWDCVVDLDTGHSPFLSAPDALAAHLLAAARLAG